MRIGLKLSRLLYGAEYSFISFTQTIYELLRYSIIKLFIQMGILLYIFIDFNIFYILGCPKSFFRFIK